MMLFASESKTWPVMVNRFISDLGYLEEFKSFLTSANNVNLGFQSEGIQLYF